MALDLDFVRDCYKANERGDGLLLAALIRCGLVPAMVDIYRIILEDEYRDVNDNVYPVRLALQDALGHNTAEIYDFCESNRGMFIPTIGRQTMAVPYDSRPVEFYPGVDKKTFPGALRRLNVNSSLYKNRVDPGGLALHSEVSEPHLAQLCAEVRAEDGFRSETLGGAG